MKGVLEMTLIEVTFLGTTAAIPTRDRNHAAVYLRYQSENEYACLFDCGEGTQRQIFSSGLNFMRINDIFITHWHADHFAGLLGLVETMNLEDRKKPLTIYAPEAEKFVPMLMDIGYSTKDFEIIARNVEFEGHEIEHLVENPEFFVAAIPMRHGVPAVAYAFVEKDRTKIDKGKAHALGLPPKGLIYRKLKDEGKTTFKGKEIRLENIAAVEKGKKVVYTGDTMPNPNTIKIAENADLLIHDSTFLDEMENRSKHSTVDDVLKIAAAAKVKQLVLTHISRRYQDTQEIKDKLKSYPNVRIARDFMKMEI